MLLNLQHEVATQKTPRVNTDAWMYEKQREIVDRKSRNQKNNQRTKKHKNNTKHRESEWSMRKEKFNYVHIVISKYLNLPLVGRHIVKLQRKKFVKRLTRLAEYRF